MTTINRPEPRLAERGQPNLERDEQRTGDGSIGQQLPPIPRAIRPAVAAGRKRVRALEDRAPLAGAVAVAVAIAVIATAALALVARSRRHTPADQLIARLGQVPDRIAASRG